jgi:hypothetical protein
VRELREDDGRGMKTESGKKIDGTREMENWPASGDPSSCDRDHIGHPFDAPVLDCASCDDERGSE